jgi:hypothetical protein
MAMIVAPSSVAHAETLHFAFMGRSAGAFFTSLDQTGCVVTQVGISARDGKVKSGTGGFEQQVSATIFIDIFDTCTGQQLRAGFGEPMLTAGQFRIEGFDSASLNAEIELFDFLSSAPFRVNVSLAWRGVGDTITADKFREHFKSPNFSYNAQSSGTFRTAVASGTVTYGTTNFTPTLSESAQLSAVKSSIVYIIHE